jgi:DNA-binding CsgD family transcriptional regulator
MASPDWSSYLISALLGALMVILFLQLRRMLAQRQRNRSDHTHSFDVRMVGDIEQIPERRWRWDSLTEREIQVARLVAYGKRNAEIAHELHISPHTVESHLKHIYSKLDIRSRIELARVLRDLVE